MEFLGLHLDHRKNDVRGNTLRDISVPGSSVKILVAPTNEELEIAKQSYVLVN
jgi:acetate kinase